jgi:hypothetical protein
MYRSAPVELSACVSEQADDRQPLGLAARLVATEKVSRLPCSHGTSGDGAVREVA